jgi:hypothetical protein
MKSDRRKINLKLIGILIVIATTTLSYQNCAKIAFSSVPEAPVAQISGDRNLPVASPPLPAAPGTAVSIRQFKPALAVRDFSCLACHANIQANVVTDLGYGDPWYLNSGGSQTSFGDTHYLPTSWQSMDQVNGQIIVPNVLVPAESANANLASGSKLTSPVAMLDYLTMSNISDLSKYWTFQIWNRPEPQNLALTGSVIAPAGKAAVVAKNVVYIGAPTREQILNLVKNSSAAPWFQSVDPKAPGTGFSIVQGGSSSYVTNAGPIQCSGQDIVVNGTLLLNNLKIVAENGGCRLYVTGTVFIQGPIVYLNSGSRVDSTNNLQITSSAAIILGVGLVDGSNQPLRDRLIGDGVRNNMRLRSATTDSAYQNFANAILSEGTNIGSTVLRDAGQYGNAPTANAATSGVVREKIDFQHLLVNAPLIHSRYLGTFNGVIVAESAMFSLGEFSFHYDSIFESVPVLPAFQKDILCVGDAIDSCNPIQSSVMK